MLEIRLALTAAHLSLIPRRDVPRAVSLMYHDVEPGSADASGFTGKGPARYKLDPDLFRAHLDAIAAAGGRPGSVLALETSERRGRRWPVLLTFDDGGASAEEIGEALSALGWTGHFFITVDFLGRPGFLDDSGVRRLAHMGHVIGTHSCSHHVPFNGLSEDRLLEEWRRSVSVLTEIVGSPVVVGSVPGGYSSRQVELSAARSGLRALFTSEPVASGRRVEGCLVFGRYAILSGTSSVAVERLVRGEVAPRLRQLASWKVRGLAKIVLGDRYRALRTRLLETG
jgi:peptidoglycan/xylan/chitin deacetylase (PgdA/CDA1 family)